MVKKIVVIVAYLETRGKGAVDILRACTSRALEGVCAPSAVFAHPSGAVLVALCTIASVTIWALLLCILIECWW